MSRRRRGPARPSNERTTALGPSSLAELLGHEREREEAPGELEVAREVEHGRPHARQLAGAERELVEAGRERLQP